MDEYGYGYGIHYRWDFLKERDGWGLDKIDTFFFELGFGI